MTILTKGGRMNEEQLKVLRRRVEDVLRKHPELVIKIAVDFRRKKLIKLE